MKPLLIMDNASIHKANLVKKLSNVYNFFFLPPYSPNLNLIEYLFAPWKHFISEEAYKNRQAPTARAFLETSLKVNKFSLLRAKSRFFDSLIKELDRSDPN